MGALLPETSVRARVRVPDSPRRRREPAELPEMVLLVMVRVPPVRYAAAEGRIVRNGAVGHGEGAGVRHTAAVRNRNCRRWCYW